MGKCLDAFVSRAIARATRDACAALALSCFAAPALPTGGRLDESITGDVRKLATEGVRATTQASRFDVSVGSLDTRLRLAACERIEPYLPANTRLWGRTRIGLRCSQGASLWNVYLPINVKVYGRALVATAALPAGAVLTAADLRVAEIDWAEQPGKWYTQPEDLIGRTLARAIAPGQGLRAPHLKARQWFAAGDTVRITTQGVGFAVTGVGEALSPGIEGQSARVRTEAGRV